MKKCLLLLAMFSLSACVAGTLTVTDKQGHAKSYRVLDCNMTYGGVVSYTDMKGKIKTVEEPFASALYENKFNAKRYENCNSCN